METAKLEENAAEWLQGMGLNGHKEPAATVDLADIRRRWERIQGWMERPLIEREAEGSLSGEAIQGNLDNLDQLLAELGDLDLADEVRVLVQAISEAAYQLEGMI